MEVKVFQIHKRSSYVFDEIQDKYAIDVDNKIFALSDGATQAFKSELWAESLVESFVKEPRFSPKELINYFTEKAKEFNEIKQDFSENFAIRAVEKRKQELGSFATFLGFQVDNDSVNYISSGDVCFFVLRDGKLISSYPFDTVSELDADKGFLGTEKLLRGEVSEDSFYQRTFSFAKEDKIILTTDAIARYLLKSQDFEIFTCKTFSEFKDFVLNLWETKVLEEDDISLIEISNLSDSEIVVEENLPTDDFSFPKEEQHHIPSISKTLTPEEMKELNELKVELMEMKKNLKESNEGMIELNRKVRSIKVINFLLLGILLLSIPFLIWNNFPSLKNFKTNLKNSEVIISGKEISDTDKAQAIENGNQSMTSTKDGEISNKAKQDSLKK